MNTQTIIFLLFSYISELLIFIFYCYSFTTAKYTFRKILLISFCSYLGMFFLSLIDNPMINVPLYATVNLVLLFFLFNSSALHSIVHTIILTFVMVLTEFLTLILLQRYTIDYYNELYTLQNRIFFAIISKLMFFTFTFFIARTFGMQTKTLSISKRIPLRIYLVPMLSFLLVFLVLLAWSRNFSFVNSLPAGLFIPIITILIMLLNILVFWDEFNRIKRITENHSLQLQLQRESDMRDYYKNLIRESEYRSTLIHDIKNHLHSIQSLASAGNVKEINSYINNLLGTPALSQSIHRSDCELLNSILSRYSYECRCKNISFDTDIRKNTIDFLPAEDMTTLFCNMLDNAIEANEKIESHDNLFIDMIIEPRMDNAFTIIKLRNSFDGKELLINPKGSIQTAKSNKENHGFGTKSMISVVNKYEGNIDFEPDYIKKIFTLIITLKKPTTCPDDRKHEHTD